MLGGSEALSQDPLLSVRDVALQNNIGVATAHKILTETLLNSS